jgi:hypothetical protein
LTGVANEAEHISAGQRPSAAILCSLETLIAPGRMARLSPYVEAAQVEVLFQQLLDDGARTDHMEQIFDANATRIDRIARSWLTFKQERTPYSAFDYSDPRSLDAYLAYCFGPNLRKVQWVLLDLLRDGHIPNEITLLDVGVGTGTTAVALLDFLLAWGTVCELHGEPFPVIKVSLGGLDAAQAALDYADRVVGAYARALQQRLKRPSSRTSGAERDEDLSALQRVHEWASSHVEWLHCDLDVCAPAPKIQPNLVVLSNVLDELDPERDRTARRNLQDLLRRLPAGAVVVALEPGGSEKSNALMRWRRQLVNESDDFVPLGPCGSEFGGQLPASCATCSHWRREPLGRSALYRRLQLAENALTGRNGDQRPAPTSSLGWSYVAVGRCVRGEQPPQSLPEGRAPPQALPYEPSDGRALGPPTALRYIGAFKDDQPVDYGPDSFGANPSDSRYWNEYFRACPATFDARRVRFERPPGFEVPPLHYGQRFELTGAEVARSHQASPR